MSNTKSSNYSLSYFFDLEKWAHWYQIILHWDQKMFILLGCAHVRERKFFFLSYRNQILHSKIPYQTHRNCGKIFITHMLTHKTKNKTNVCFVCSYVSLFMIEKEEKKTQQRVELYRNWFLSCKTTRDCYRFSLISTKSYSISIFHFLYFFFQIPKNK